MGVPYQALGYVLASKAEPATHGLGLRQPEVEARPQSAADV